MRTFIATVLMVFVGVLAVAQNEVNQSNAKTAEPRLLRNVCGVVFDPSGAHIPNTTVEILRGEKVISSTVSLPDGSFSFPKLSAGKYDVRAMLPGFKTLRFAINIQKPTKRCELPMHLQLHVGESGGVEVLPQK